MGRFRGRSSGSAAGSNETRHHPDALLHSLDSQKYTMFLIGSIKKLASFARRGLKTRPTYLKTISFPWEPEILVEIYPRGGGELSAITEGI